MKTSFLPGRMLRRGLIPGAALIAAAIGPAVASAQTLTTLVSFNGNDGGNPSLGHLIADANGNLFGTVLFDGVDGYGTAFEIVKTPTGYASAPTILFTFDATHGAYPNGGLLADANGNLFGTTARGGLTNNGTAFEIAKTSSGYASTPTILFNFDGVNGAVPWHPDRRRQRQLLRHHS
jgi:hypothetical protein